MKKSLLALAVLGAFAGAAQAQSSVTIYGIVDTGITYTSKVATGTGTGSKFAVNSGNIQGSRIGFKGVEDLGGGLSAVFQLETGFTNDNGGLQGSDAVTSSNLFRRKSVVGLSGGFGTVLLGRQTDFEDTIYSIQCRQRVRWRDPQRRTQHDRYGRYRHQQIDEVHHG